jgi:TniQ
MKCRWPLILKQKPLESLTSWLERHAKYYKIDLQTLFCVGLHINIPNDLSVIDISPTEKILSAIFNSTGLSIEEIEEMTFKSLCPTIFDFVGSHTKEQFESFFQFTIFKYRSQYKNKHNDIENIDQIIPWLQGSTWFYYYPVERFCPKCILEKNSYKLLAWRLCLLSTCPIHKCFLTEIFLNKHKMRKNDIKIILNDDLLAAVLKIDNMSLQGLYKGYVTFDNGEIINSTVWFRLLRVFVREICKVENISYDYREKIIILWKKIGLDFIPNRLFEDLKQEERIAIVSIISELVVNWPENILTLLGREIDFFGVTKPKRFPYVLAKYIDFPMHRYLEVKYNKEFYLRCMDLRIEGWWDEFRYHLNLSKENRKNFSKYLLTRPLII